MVFVEDIFSTNTNMAETVSAARWSNTLQVEPFCSLGTVTQIPMNESL